MVGGIAVAFMICPRTILITGASSGIGAALAMAYADDQATLVLMGRDEDRLSQVSIACRGKGASVAAIAQDVADIDRFLDVLLELDQQWRFDLVVFNAGIGDTCQPSQQIEPPQQITRLIDVNLRAPAAGASLIAGRMIDRRQGTIALISSVAALIPLPMAAGYAASKAGLNAFALSLNAAVRSHGVTVSVICPGYVETPMSARLKTFKPFQMKPEMAARAIIDCIGRRQTFTIIPAPYAIACAVLKFIPVKMAVWLSSRFSLDARAYEAMTDLEVRDVRRNVTSYSSVKSDVS